MPAHRVKEGIKDSIISDKWLIAGITSWIKSPLKRLAQSCSNFTEPAVRARKCDRQGRARQNNALCVSVCVPSHRHCEFSANCKTLPNVPKCHRNRRCTQHPQHGCCLNQNHPLCLGPHLSLSQKPRCKRDRINSSFAEEKKNCLLQEEEQY